MNDLPKFQFWSRWRRCWLEFNEKPTVALLNQYRTHKFRVAIDGVEVTYEHLIKVLLDTQWKN